MLATSWYTIFYLFSVLDRLGGMFVAFAVFSIIATIIGFIGGRGGFNYQDEEQQWGKTMMKWTFPAAILFIVTAVLLPDKKDMLLIVAGGSVGEFVSHNEDAKAIPAEVTKWLRAEIKDATAELNPAVQAQKKAYEGLDKEELVKRLLTAKDSIK